MVISVKRYAREMRLHTGYGFSDARVAASNENTLVLELSGTNVFLQVRFAIIVPFL